MGQISSILGGVVILRIIAGSAKGHRIKTLEGNTTRPTQDRVKESLFNIIAPKIADAKVLDLFAGTGNLGIEALSRGAKDAVFVDKSVACTAIIKENLEKTRLSELADVITGDVTHVIHDLAMKSIQFDIIFIDPPYHKNLINETFKIIEKNAIIKDKGIVIAERDIKDSIPEEIGLLKRVRDEKYGDTMISFYQMQG